MADQYKAKYQEVFKKYDTNGDGYIDKKELQSFTKKFIEEIIGEKVGDKDIDEAAEELLKILDENGDNVISWEEFWKYFSGLIENEINSGKGDQCLIRKQVPETMLGK